MKNDWRSRRHPAYLAFLAHRVSGLLLAIFLPVHFWVLARALHGPQGLDDLLRWTEHPVVKLSEVGLVLLLALHFTGGLRLLMLEFLAWRDWQINLLVIAAGTSVAISLVFAFNLL